jgi:LSD1 subclass zinc finger protein
MNEGYNDKTADVVKELKCSGCGALLTYQPGTLHLACAYCGAVNEITEATVPAEIKETDYEAYLKIEPVSRETEQVSTVQCSNCGATTTLQPGIVSDRCPFCDTPLVIANAGSTTMIRPHYLLPFHVDRKEAAEGFKKWCKGLWFAPSDLVQKVSTDKLAGMYLPYRTFDSQTVTNYDGQRGTYYYTTETYTVTENGQSVTKTRSVRHTAWSSVSGVVNNMFDDLLVLASFSLPEKYSRKLEPWDLHELVAYNEKFLSGFRTETYRTDVQTGFNGAKEMMVPEIEDTIRGDIGGDEQRIDDYDTEYYNVTFKHILLPLWISTYRYNNKVYRFMVNARTGEVQGERPWSALKITLFVLFILVAIIMIVFLANDSGSY